MKRILLYTLAILFASLQTFAQTYTYDNLNRLTKVVYDNGTTVSYTYDELGNRTSKEVTGATAPKKAYAWLSSDGKTLTFCYDDSMMSKEGIIYNLNEDNQWPEYNAEYITKVVFDSSFADVRPTTTFMWFSGMKNLTTIENMQYLNTSDVTNMGFMFYECSSLKSVDVSHFDTSNVTNMDYMFATCSELTEIDVSHFDTSNTTSMISMFSDCYELVNLDLSHFDTSNVTNMFYMFYECSGLRSLDVSNFDTSNVSDMYKMFYGLKISSLDVSNFDISKCEDTRYMFSRCTKLESLCISSSMENLSETACEDVGWWKPCTLIAPEDFDFGVDVSGDSFTWKSGTFKLGNPMGAYAWLSSDGKTLTFCYDNIREERVGETYDLRDQEYWSPDWFAGFDTPSTINKVAFEPSFAKARPQYTCYWFAKMEELTDIIGLQNLNTSEVKSMYNMFNGCIGLTSLDLSHFNTSMVTNMGQMFDECKGLNTLDLSHFDTSNVTSMVFMFSDCSSLESVNLSSFNTSNVIQTHYMFRGCTSLKNIDIGHFDMSNVTSTTGMFYNCSDLQTLRIPSHMEDIDNSACAGVGTMNTPCTLITPRGFDFGVDTSGSYFVWKGGFFKLPDIPTDIGTMSEIPSSEEFDVYSLDGALLYRNITQEQLKLLPKGVYIRNGQKVVVK